MGFLINMYAKLTGLTNTIMDWLPVVGAVGSCLSVAASIAIRVSTAKSPAEVVAALHPTADEIGELTLAVGLIKAHMNHRDNKQAITQVPPAAQPSALPK